MPDILWIRSSVVFISSDVSLMYPWNIVPICIHIERIKSTSTQKGINMVLCKKSEMLFAKHMFKRIIFIITPVISIMNRNSSRDIQTSLSMMTPDIQSLSITHHFICIVVTDSVVKAKNHCRRRHHHHHHHPNAFNYDNISNPHPFSSDGLKVWLLNTFTVRDEGKKREDSLAL